MAVVVAPCVSAVADRTVSMTTLRACHMGNSKQSADLHKQTALAPLHYP